MARIQDGPWAPGAGTLGLSLVVPAVLLVPTLASGGLAPLAVAALVALLVAAPAAVAEWRTPREHQPVLAAAGEGLGDLVALLVVAAATAGLVAGAGAIGWLLAVSVWVLAAIVHRAPATAALPGALAVAVAVAGAVAALATGAEPYTLLEAHWGSWSSWLGTALVAGLWMGGAGTAEWTLGPVRRPGETRGPWAGTGAALLLLGALALRQGVRFEASLGTPGPDPVSLAVLTLAGASAAATLLRRRPVAGTYPRRPWVPRLILGGLATLWLAGPAAGAVPFGWSTGLPLAMLALFGLTAGRLEGIGRVQVLLAAGLAAVAGVLAWRGLPRGVLDAATAAATVAVGFWLVATRAVLARRLA